MNTETVTNATDAETQYIEAQEWLTCSICGVFVTQFDYAHNTCSQGCARTAAIVEAINGWQLASFPKYYIETDLKGKQTARQYKPPNMRPQWPLTPTGYDTEPPHSDTSGTAYDGTLP